MLAAQSRLMPRPELQIEQPPSDQRAQSRLSGAERWVVFDPVSRRTFRLGWLEHWLLARVDGRRTVAQIVALFRRDFSTLELSDTRLLTALQQLATSELVRGASPSQPKGNAWSTFASGLVVWQIRGLQPDRFLSWVAPWCNALFSPLAVKLWCLLASLTLALVTLEFRRLASQAAHWDWFLLPSSGGMLLAVFLVTRALHELGHAIVCTRFGVRCPDVGVFLILGAPCVYCDVSDCWRLTQRWKRAAVAAAGMYVEIVVATLAAWIWLATIDGQVNTLALQTMFVCSVSTVLINANPLMRFDGYYVLADWLDEANLRGRADSLALQTLHRVLLGPGVANTSELPNPRSRARRRLLVAFSIAGWIYRAGLSLTIASVLIAIYSGWNLVWVGRGLASIVLVSWWGVPAMRLLKNLVTNAISRPQQFRLAAISGVFVVAIAAVPLPKRRFASGWLQPLETQGVFTSQEGVLVATKVEDGGRVEPGSDLFELTSLQVELQCLERERLLNQARLRLEAANQQRNFGENVDPTPLADLVGTTSELYKKSVSNREGLQVRAVSGGRFCAARAVALELNESAEGGGREHSSQTGVSNERFGKWCDPAQVGRTVPKGTLLGTICSERLAAVVPLAESQLSEVASGSEVRLKVHYAGHSVICTQVQSVVPFEAAASLWQQAELQTATRNSRESTSGQSQTQKFAAIVILPGDFQCPPGATVDAVFVVPSATVASLCGNWLKSNLRLLAD